MKCLSPWTGPDRRRVGVGGDGCGMESNDGVYFVPAFVGLGAPHWVPEARGALFGLTRGTTREHLVRAALEAMAYGTQEVLDAMEADSSTKTTELRVDGGAAENDWLLGFQAGLLGVPVRRPDVVETTALGRRVWPDLPPGSGPMPRTSSPVRGRPPSSHPACQTPSVPHFSPVGPRRFMP